MKTIETMAGELQNNDLSHNPIDGLQAQLPS